MQNTIDLLEVRHIALAASVDPRTVLKELRAPGSVTKAAGARVRRELARRGYSVEEPQKTAAISHSPQPEL